MFFIIALCLFPFTGIVIFLYLRSIYRLLKGLQNNAPDIWEKLGKPKVFGQGIWPIFPLLVWVWKGQVDRLPANIACNLINTRRLFIGGITIFLINVVFILLSIAMGE